MSLQNPGGSPEGAPTRTQDELTLFGQEEFETPDRNADTHESGVFDSGYVASEAGNDQPQEAQPPVATVETEQFSTAGDTNHQPGTAPNLPPPPPGARIQEAAPLSREASPAPTRNMKLWAAIGGGLTLLGVGAGVGMMASGEPSKETPVSVAPSEDLAPNDAVSEVAEEPELIVNNVCDVMTPSVVGQTLGLNEAQINGRSCYSDVEHGVITHVEWQAENGIYLNAFVFDDVMVGQTSVRSDDGSLVGYGDFADYTSLQADSYFTIKTHDGRVFDAAYNSQTLRVKVEDRVIGISVGQYLETGDEPMEVFISEENSSRYIGLAKSLVEGVFAVDVVR